MVEIRFIVHTASFKHDVKKIKDKTLKERLRTQIQKVTENPKFGKPLKYSLKGEWSIRIKHYRLIYKVEGDKLILLRFEHRKDVYERQSD
jgi:addiction module RelE/StbE family toxin